MHTGVGCAHGPRLYARFQAARKPHKGAACIQVVCALALDTRRAWAARKGMAFAYRRGLRERVQLAPLRAAPASRAIVMGLTLRAVSVFSYSVQKYVLVKLHAARFSAGLVRRFVSLLFAITVVKKSRMFYFFSRTQPEFRIFAQIRFRVRGGRLEGSAGSTQTGLVVHRA